MGGGFNSISPQLTGPAPAGVRRDDMDKEFRRFAGILQSRTSSFFVGSKAVDKVFHLIKSSNLIPSRSYTVSHKPYKGGSMISRVEVVIPDYTLVLFVEPGTGKQQSPPSLSSLLNVIHQIMTSGKAYSREIGVIPGSVKITTNGVSCFLTKGFQLNLFPAVVAAGWAVEDTILRSNRLMEERDAFFRDQSLYVQMLVRLVLFWFKSRQLCEEIGIEPSFEVTRIVELISVAAGIQEEESTGGAPPSILNGFSRAVEMLGNLGSLRVCFRCESHSKWEYEQKKNYNGTRSLKGTLKRISRSKWVITVDLDKVAPFPVLLDPVDKEPRSNNILASMNTDTSLLEKFEKVGRGGKALAARMRNRAQCSISDNGWNVIEFTSIFQPSDPRTPVKWKEQVGRCGFEITSTFLPCPLSADADSYSSLGTIEGAESTTPTHSLILWTLYESLQRTIASVKGQNHDIKTTVLKCLKREVTKWSRSYCNVENCDGELVEDWDSNDWDVVISIPFWWTETTQDTNRRRVGRRVLARRLCVDSLRFGLVWKGVDEPQYVEVDKYRRQNAKEDAKDADYVVEEESSSSSSSSSGSSSSSSCSSCSSSSDDEISSSSNE